MMDRAPVGTVTHRPWSTLMLGLASLGAVLGALPLFGGLLVALSADPGTADQSLGLSLAAVGFAVTAMNGAVAGMTVVGRRRADEGRPALLRAAGVVAAVVGVLDLVSRVSDLGTGAGLLSAAMGFVVSGLFVFAGIKVVLATRA